MRPEMPEIKWCTRKKPTLNSVALNELCVVWRRSPFYMDLGNPGKSMQKGHGVNESLSEFSPHFDTNHVG